MGRLVDVEGAEKVAVDLIAVFGGVDDLVIRVLEDEEAIVVVVY
jgi:hypothetical protein